MSAAGTPWTWNLEPLQLVPLLCTAGAYAVRGWRIGLSATRAASFASGVGIVALAIVSPLNAVAEERLFSAHMAQHLVVGDLGPLLVVVGLTDPGFGRSGVLRHPLVALPLWALNLCLWHLPVLYDAALRHESIHALQHALFFACGVLLWAALLLPGPAWFGTGAKIGYVATAWLVGTALAQVFIWSGSAFYEPYREAPRLWGITPHGDQVAGGGLMMFEGTVVMVGVIVWLLLGVLQEPDQAAAESAT